jgi:hypothetical protein
MIPIFLIVFLYHFKFMQSHMYLILRNFFASPPRTARPSRIVDCGQSLVISVTSPPDGFPRSCKTVQTVFPEKSYSDGNATIGMGIVSHQLDSQRQQSIIQPVMNSGLYGVCTLYCLATKRSNGAEAPRCKLRGIRINKLSP